MKKMTLLGLIGFCFSTGCGQHSGKSTQSGNISTSKTDTSQQTTGASGGLPTTMLVADVAGLPSCQATNEGQLAFVKSANQFQACSSGTWATVSVGSASKSVAVNVQTESPGANCAAGGLAIQTGQEANGNGTLEATEVSSTKYTCNGTSIASIWKYHTDTYVGSTDLNKGGFTYGEVGEIQLTQFTDGSAWVSVGGYTTDVDSAAAQNTTWSPFLDAFYMTAGQSGSDIARKFQSYLGERLHYKITLGATPTIQITIDNDGTLSNDTLTTFTLSKQ